jgi:Alkylmercury lyase
MRSSTELDTAVRLFVYERFLDDGSPPSYEATAAALGITPEMAAAAYERLAEQRVLVLAPGTLDVWMAHPFSAYPTAFSVATPRRSYWGSCIWDAFGVIAMTGGSGVVSTTCQDCGDSMRLEVEEFELAPAEGIAHFAVPARDWWKNIGYT